MFHTHKPLRQILLASAVSVATLASAGVTFAQDAAAPAASADSEPVQTVVVIGTRRTDRTLTNTASPVDVISSADLRAQPSGNMLDTLKNIVPSFFVGQNTISDASSFVRAPSLRGLPGDEILVMLDGKRYNRSALVQVYTGGDTGLSFGSQGSDISAIPSIAIKNLQILREGATAQYGSDAIGGVLNYGLKNNRSGGEIDIRYGQYGDNGDGQSKQISGNIGFGFARNGFVSLSGEYDDDEGTSRGATRPVALVFAQQHPDLASQLPNYPGPAQIWGSSPSHGYKAVLNSGFDVTDSSKIYFFANVAHFEANESFNYRSPISATAVDVDGVTHTLGANGAFKNTFYLTPCPANTVTCPSGGFVKDSNTFLYTSLYPAGFTPRFVGVTNQAFGTLGYKGTTSSNLTYDMSVSTSKNSLDLSMYDSLSPTYGPDTQTSFKFGQLIQKETDVNLDLTYPIPVSAFASPITLAGGAEWRKETYTQTSGDEQSYGAGPYAVAQTLYTPNGDGTYSPAGTTSAQSPGASGYGGTSPAASGTWSQESYAGYLDAETDITSALSVGLAVRAEHYSTFGSATVGKFNALYRFSDMFSVRGTVGTGFHAPSPGQSNDEILTTNFVGGNQVQTGTYPVDSVVSQYYGASTLKPEKSTNYGLGFIAKPVKNWTLTVDAYDIEVKDRIGISQNFSVTAADVINEPALAAVGVGGVINYFTNGFDTVTQGVDVVSTYHINMEANGSLNLTLAYNYNKSKVTSFDPLVISNAQIIGVAHLAPNTRATLSANWSVGKFSINGRANFYSWWQDEVDYPGQKFGDKTTEDLDVSYAINDKYTVSLGGTNILNIHPDRIAQSSSNFVYPVTGSLADGQIYPRSGGPFGINGAFWYARLRVTY